MKKLDHARDAEELSGAVTVKLINIDPHEVKELFPSKPPPPSPMVPVGQIPNRHSIYVFHVLDISMC
jgi:hypothetical protein